MEHISGPISRVLAQLARQVEANVPDHRRPEAFHERKSEIANRLRQLAGTAERPEAHVDG